MFASHTQVPQWRTWLFRRLQKLPPNTLLYKKSFETPETPERSTHFWRTSDLVVSRSRWEREEWTFAQFITFFRTLSLALFFTVSTYSARSNTRTLPYDMIQVDSSIQKNSRQWQTHVNKTNKLTSIDCPCRGFRYSGRRYWFPLEVNILSTVINYTVSQTTLTEFH